VIHHPLRVVAGALALVAVALVMMWALYLARGALVVLYVSLLLAVGLAPFVRAIERNAVPVIGWRIPRWLAILVIYVFVLGTVTLVAIMIVPPLVDQTSAFTSRIPEWLDRGQDFLLRIGVINHRITLEEAVRQAPGSPTDAVGTVASGVSRLGETILGLITILVLTFYLLLESESLFAAFSRLFDPEDRPRVGHAARQISAKVSAWLSGQLILAGTIGISSAIGLYFIGVPYYYVLALISGIGEMIPIVGPILSAIPAALVALTVSPKTMLFVLLFFLVQQQLENHLLVPKIMQRQVGVSPVVVIAALLIGGAALGIVGALLAVPTAAVIQVIAGELLDERDRRRAHTPV